MVTIRKMIKDRLVKIKIKGRRAKGEVKVGEGLGAEVKVGGAGRGKENEVCRGEEEVKGTATGVGEGITPKSVAAVKVTNHH